MTARPQPAGLQRANGALTLDFDSGGAGGSSRLAGLYQSDPCRALLPRPDPGEPLTAILITTSGGLTGGDRLDIAIRCAPEADVLCTPQAAEKIYRAEGDSDARIVLGLEVGAGAQLEWLPQEMILFDGSRLRRDLRIELAGDARLLAGDITVFGRIARGENFDGGLLFDRWQLRRDGRLVWTDALRLEGAVAALRDHPAGFAGAVAQGLILCQAPDAETWRTAVRDLAEAGGMTAAGTAVGATLLDGLLLVRLLDTDPARLRRHFATLWAGLRPALGRAARMPRLWHL